MIMVILRFLVPAGSLVIFLTLFVHKILSATCHQPMTPEAYSSIEYNSFLNDQQVFIAVFADDIESGVIEECLSIAVKKFPSTAIRDRFNMISKGFTFSASTASVVNFVRSFDGVQSVNRVKKFYANSVPISWGQDRLDQVNLPLDGRYETDWNGTGVSVFVVDSGIDTNHAEFIDKNNKSTALNVYDVSVKHGKKIRRDNDDVGHGTHVAATVGGRTTGVSPGVKLYGVRVLDEHGSGEDTHILSGLTFVRDWYLSHHRPSPTVVTMSLGGSCLSYLDCETDSVVLAVEKLIRLGIHVVVAAGNDDCDACLQTPAYSKHVITVGASNSKDIAAQFSDFGKCVDIYAPGDNITSACAPAMCSGDRDATGSGEADEPGSDQQYISLSGTSMACPHVAGETSRTSDNMLGHILSLFPFVARFVISMVPPVLPHLLSLLLPLFALGVVAQILEIYPLAPPIEVTYRFPHFYTRASTLRIRPTNRREDS